jgi:hypothetical protein
MTTTINFTSNIVEVGTILKTMLIRYQRDKENEPPSFLHIPIPKKGEVESMDDYIKSHAPIGTWMNYDINEVVEYEDIEIGTTVNHAWTPTSTEPIVPNIDEIPDQSSVIDAQLYAAIQKVLSDIAGGTV